MGCWNETCAITHVPIYSGDDIVMIFLTNVSSPTKNAAGACYSNEFWSPRSIQFYGKYNDYGGIEDVPNNWHTDYFLKSLKRDVINREQGENKYHDHAVDADKLTDLDIVQELIHDDRIQLRVNSFKDERKFGLLGRMFILRSVFDAMCQETDGWNPVSLSKYIEDGFELYAEMNRIGEKTHERLTVIDALREIEKSKNNRTSSRNAFSVIERGGSEVDSYNIKIGIRDYMEEMARFANEKYSIDDPVVVDLITEMAKFLIFNENMNDLRRAYTPQVGAGSQSNSHKLHTRVLTAGIDYLKSKDEEWDYDGDDDAVEDEVTAETA